MLIKEVKMNNQIQGVIFDNDGIISDTQKIHAQIESDLLRYFGVDLSSDDITHQFAGVRTSEFMKTLLNNAGVLFEINHVMQQKRLNMTRFIEEGTVNAIPGVVALIKMFFKKGLKLGVGSASPFDLVSVIHRKLNLAQYFSSVVCGDQVEQRKPHPETFLKCASAIGIAPENCVVFEDGLSAIVAAKSASMRCIALATHLTYRECTDAGTDLVVDSFENCNQKIIIDFFG